MGISKEMGLIKVVGVEVILVQPTSNSNYFRLVEQFFDNAPFTLTTVEDEIP